jgi:hypothetical protein
MILLVALLVACSGESDPTAAPAPATPTAPSAVEPAAPPPPRVVATTARRVAASHILVTWAGAVGALPNISRTRDEARVRAEQARAKVLAGEDFAAVARPYSDDATARRGGDLGGFEDGTMVAPFEAAVKQLAVGGVSPLVETPFGYHVIRRDELREIHAAHLVVTWKGAERAPSGIERDKDAAKALADRAASRIAAGEAWDAVVLDTSDGPLREEGGDLGWFTRGQLAGPLDSAAFELAPGEVTAVVETARGYHIVKRLE